MRSNRRKPYDDLALVRRLAQEYRMPESYIRQMLAIENGDIAGDVVDRAGGTMTRKPDPLAPGLIRQVGGRSTGSIHSNARRSLATVHLALCVNADGVHDLTKGRYYRVLPDSVAPKNEWIRVIDDSGEDYLYHPSRFVEQHVPENEAVVLLIMR